MTDSKPQKSKSENQVFKQCSKCKCIKLVQEFQKRARSKDGLKAHCKSCASIYSNQYHQTHREEILIKVRQHQQKHKKERAVYIKQYQQEHKTELATYKKQYYQEHKEEIILYKEQYYQEHKEGLLVRGRQYKQDHKEEIMRWRQDHKEEIAIQHRQYCQEHKEEIVIQRKQYYQTPTGRDVTRKATKKRRALKLGVEYEKFSDREIFERDNYICQLCGVKTRPDLKNKYHPLYPNLDHIVPLTKGGAHTKLNTQCLCHQCNSKKGNTGVGDQLRLFG